MAAYSLEMGDCDEESDGSIKSVEIGTRKQSKSPTSGESVVLTNAKRRLMETTKSEIEVGMWFEAAILFKSCLIEWIRSALEVSTKTDSWYRDDIGSNKEIEVIASISKELQRTCVRQFHMASTLQPGQK